jgi:multidrug resistance efflux pump
MAKKNGLRDTAVKVGAAVGKIDGRAHKAALRAARVARQEFSDLTKQLEALKRQLEKSTKRLKNALK